MDHARRAGPRASCWRARRARRRSPPPGRARPRRPCRGSRRTVPASRRTQSAFARVSVKSAAARCSAASASPRAAQCSTVIRRGQLPSRQLTMAAGLPASRRSATPSRACTGSGQGRPWRARCSIRPRKNGRSARVDALLVDGQDEAAALGQEAEVGVLDPLGDALERNRRPELVVGEEGVQARQRRPVCRRPPAQEALARLGDRRRAEGDRLLGHLDLLDRDRAAGAAGGHDLLDQQLGRRGAGRQAQGRHAVEPGPVDVGGRADQLGARRHRAGGPPRPAARSWRSWRHPPPGTGSARGAIAATARCRLVVA